MKFQIFIVLFFLLLLLSCKNNDTKKEDFPNIIFLVSEDNSPFLGCYGDTLANTLNLDAFAKESIKFNNAFANAPVCAPSRSTIISGMYATSMGTQHMRSENKSPAFMKFFPYYLRKAGYFTSNRVKKDYNTMDQDSVWDISDWWAWKEALKGKKNNQPFFIMYNTWMSHESKIHPNSDNYGYFKGTMQAHGVDTITIQKYWEEAKFDTVDIKLPLYHPNTPELKKDWSKYYECIELMDREMGVVLNKIKEDGYWDNSIVFYFSDHGGVLARSKRYIFDSGLKVPFLLHIPAKYNHMTNLKMGSKNNRVISFVDLAPTLLTIAGIDIPKYMEGHSFLGTNKTKEEKYSFGFRGRMDERYDMVRTVRDKRFRYIRNYMPHRIYGGKIKYLWKAKSVSSWEDAYIEGKCNRTQSKFWQAKPFEELYDCLSDPDNVNNLVTNIKYFDELKRLRKALNIHLIKTKDLGFIPEAEMIKRSAESTPYETIRNNNFPFEKVFETANLAAQGKLKNLNILKERLNDPEPVVRYWATTGCTVLKKKSLPVKDNLLKLLNDESVNVRIAAAEALFYLDEKKKAIKTFINILQLPKLKKEDSSLNKMLYSNHFALTSVLNVIDALKINSDELNNLIVKIANSERKPKQNYDKRIAEDIIKISINSKRGKN